MIRCFFYNTIFFSVFLSIGLFSTAQNKITIKASVDKNKILIGEVLQLRVEASVPASQQFVLPTIDSIAHFEILKAGEPAKTVNDVQQIITQDYLLTSFDSGHWVIPSFRLAQHYLT